MGESEEWRKRTGPNNYRRELTGVLLELLWRLRERGMSEGFFSFLSRATGWAGGNICFEEEMKMMSSI